MIEKTLNKNEYTTLLSESVVRIGGDDLTTGGKFVPNVNISKYSDEAYLNINHPDVVTTEKQILKDDKVSITIGNNTHRIYVLPNGRLEYDIEFATRPPTNQVFFDIDFSPGLRFVYQDTLENDFNRNKVIWDAQGIDLTQYLIDNIRPDEVVGSYAVFFNNKNNQYRSGKFCHIYRPKLIDNLGKEIFADIDIDIPTKKMTISMDAGWLNSASYPVILDPEIGDTGKPATEWGSSSPTNIAMRGTTDGSGGDTIQVHGWFKNTHGSLDKSWKLGVYDNTSSLPANLLLSSVEITESPSFDGEDAAAYVTSLSASTDYWIVFVQEDGTAKLFYDTDHASADNSFATGSNYELLDPWNHSFSLDRYYGVWADYAAAPSGPPLTAFIPTKQFVLRSRA